MFGGSHALRVALAAALSAASRGPEFAVGGRALGVITPSFFLPSSQQLPLPLPATDAAVTGEEDKGCEGFGLEVETGRPRYIKRLLLLLFLLLLFGFCVCLFPPPYSFPL